VGDRHRGVFRFKEIGPLCVGLKHKVVPQFVGKLKTPKTRVYDGYIYIVNGDYDNL
jgi:hypothetical protein